MGHLNHHAIENKIQPESVALAPQSALLSEAGLLQLRNDVSLGSGNFLDRCLVISSAKNTPFLFVDKPMYFADGIAVSEFSLDTLQQFRRALASWYLQQGVGMGNVVAVCVEDGIAPFLHYLALTSLGATIALINAGMAAEAGAAYMQQNDFDKLVTDAHSLASSQFVQHWQTIAGADCMLEVSPACLMPTVQLPAWWPRTPEDSTLVMLSHTSGTTGIPKAVLFEHRQFFMGKRARIGHFAEGLDERLLTALPQSHSAAISHLETAVLHGIPTYVLGTQCGDAVRAAIQEFAPTTVVAFPKSYMLLVESGVAQDEFPSVRRWFSMGDAAHQSHTRLMLAGAPQSRFIDAFGSSELGMALFRSESTSTRIAAQRSIGRPVEIAVAKILDAATGEEMAAGEIGMLAVRSPTITSGYWGQSKRIADAWRGGYFLTGDMAFCKNGEFFQIDRAVDVVDAPCGPLYTLQLEEAAQQVEVVCDVVVVGMDGNVEGDPTILALVLLERDASDAAELIAERVLHALRHANAAHAIHAMVLPEEAVAVAIVRNFSFMPIGATGKVLKRLLRQQAPTILQQVKNDRSASG
ncbi:MAG: acyl--CoA ligase, partial [Glaciimonas sp.]|nr:acyl--CoA ligase [Glaciimonas sp.]